MSRGQDAPVDGNGAPSARVIVVNCSMWPTFVPLVRTEALDLYGRDAQVEFWDVTASDTGDTLIWGQWPRPFAQHPRRFADEILDRLEPAGEGPVSRLAIIMVFDGPSVLAGLTDPEGSKDARPAAGVGSASGPVRIAISAIERLLVSLSVDDPSYRPNVLWIAAFHGARTASRAEAEAAYSLVAPFHTAGGPSGQFFETAVFLSGQRGRFENQDGQAFTALRVLIDLCRDEDASRTLLRAQPGSQEGRVFALRPGIIAVNPSHRIRAQLAGLIASAIDVDGLTVEDPQADQVGPVIGDLLNRFQTSSPGAIIGFRAAEDAVVAAIGDVSSLDAAAREPSVDVWEEVRSPASATQAHGRATEELRSFYAQRDARLATQRRELDDNLRDRSALLDRLQASAVDSSFGVSGQVKRHLERAYARLEAKFAGLSHDAHRLRGQYAAARVDVDVIPAAKLDQPCRALHAALLNWRPRSTPLVAAGAASLMFVVFVATIALTENANGWTALPIGGAALILSAGLCGIYFQWQQSERHRVNAVAEVQEAERKAADQIRGVGVLGLRHVATARLAGRCLPFLNIMAQRAEEIGRVSREMSRVYASLREVVDGAPGDVDDGFAAAAKDMLRTRPQEEAFKTILWLQSPPLPATGELSFDVGRGPLRYRSTLTFRDFLRVELVPRPRENAV